MTDETEAASSVEASPQSASTLRTKRLLGLPLPAVHTPSSLSSSRTLRKGAPSADSIGGAASAPQIQSAVTERSRPTREGRQVSFHLASSALPPPASPPAPQQSSNGKSSSSNHEVQRVGVPARKQLKNTDTARKAGHRSQMSMDHVVEEEEQEEVELQVEDLDWLSERRNSGYSAEDLRHLGASAWALRNAGFTAREMRSAKLTRAECLSAGFSPEALALAGYGERLVWRYKGYLYRSLVPSDSSEPEMASVAEDARQEDQPDLRKNIREVLQRSVMAVAEANQQGRRPWEDAAFSGPTFQQWESLIASRRRSGKTSDLSVGGSSRSSQLMMGEDEDGNGSLRDAARDSSASRDLAGLEA